MGNRGSAPAIDGNGTDQVGQILASKCLGYRGNFELDRDLYRKQIQLIFQKFDQEETYLVDLMQAELQAWAKKEFT